MIERSHRDVDGRQASVGGGDEVARMEVVRTEKVPLPLTQEKQEDNDGRQEREGRRTLRHLRSVLIP
jgi:hypothetical protein